MNVGVTVFEFTVVLVGCPFKVVKDGMVADVQAGKEPITSCILPAAVKLHAGVTKMNKDKIDNNIFFIITSHQRLRCRLV